MLKKICRSRRPLFRDKFDNSGANMLGYPPNETIEHDTTCAIYIYIYIYIYIHIYIYIYTHGAQGCEYQPVLTEHNVSANIRTNIIRPRETVSGLYDDAAVAKGLLAAL